MTDQEQFSNKSIAELLRNIAAAYQLHPSTSSGQRPEGGATRFKIIAYEKAADAVEHLSRELRDIWQEGKLQKVQGIGPGIGSSLAEYFEKGESSHFNEVLKGIPESVFLLMKVPGIGPKKAFRLVSQFSLVNKETVIADLRNLAKSGEIEELEGFGKKSQDDILEALDVYERQDRREERMPLPYAFEIASEVMDYLKQLNEVKQVDALGSLRRRVATIGDIDIAVVADQQDAKHIVDHFLQYPGKRSVEGAGDQKASILAAGNIRIDLRVQDAESYGSMLQYFTGSKAHNIKLREYALKKGYSLSEYGIKEVKSKHPSARTSPPPSQGGPQEDLPSEGSTPKGGGMLHTFKDEESFYAFLGLQAPEPEIREGTDEIEHAVKGTLPQLITVEDIKGDFHLHSSYDLKPSHDLGLNTYEEMVTKAKELHYDYIGFSEHNPKQSGLSEQEIIDIMKMRKEVIENALKDAPIDSYIGLEVDILPDGRIALPEKAIEYVDYLIVSLHSSFTMNMQDMTRRVLRALSYPKVKIFGHPTGRLLGKREGAELDWDQIFTFAKKNAIAMEINSGPSRLDLPDLLVKEGREYGVSFIIDTDAHAVPHMDWMQYGVYVARRGWLESKEVVNTWPAAQFRKWITSAS